MAHPLSLHAYIMHLITHWSPLQVPCGHISADKMLASVTRYVTVTNYIILPQGPECLLLLLRYSIPQHCWATVTGTGSLKLLVEEAIISWSIEALTTLGGPNDLLRHRRNDNYLLKHEQSSSERKRGKSMVESGYQKLDFDPQQISSVKWPSVVCKNIN